ncbi:MAG: DUF5671 domain-containing protein [bacterium]|nr:DUF5671 domain-containing protein [bacterium]
MLKHDSAKYAFLYLLSLVALVFMSISVGIIVFQIINKEIVDIINQYSGSYNDEIMKFAISAIIVSTPIYYLTSRQIYKNLFAGTLDKDAGVRKWLTYFILLISIVVMIGFLIATINSFLDGDLTTKFILKTLTALIIAGSVFSFYFYDIRRDTVEGKKDKVIKFYTWISLAVVLVVFVFSWFSVDSPQTARNRKIDGEILGDLNQIHWAIRDYYTVNNSLPDNLGFLTSDSEKRTITVDNISNPSTSKAYEYETIADDEYKICTDFLTSNLGDKNYESYAYFGSDIGLHDAGYQCFSRKVFSTADSKIEPTPIRL